MAKKPKPPKPKPQPNAEAAAKVAASRPKPVRGPSVIVTKRNPQVEQKFLDGLRNSWSISKSARDAGIGAETAYTWRANSRGTLNEDTGEYTDDFCIRWEQAQRDGIERIEDEAIRRAVEGVEKPVYQQGVIAGSVTEYSDTLMGLVLRGKMPALYNTERHEHTGKDGGAVEMNMTVSFVKSEQKK
jgi:hypothetical protein